MREYKFRGKEIDTGKWVYGGLFKEPAPPQCFEKTLEDKYWIVYTCRKRNNRTIHRTKR